MAENVHSDIIINVDTSVGIAEIKNLQRQISALNAQLMQSGAAQARSAQNIQRNLINNINATGQFAARVKTISSTTENFTSRLEKNKLGMGEYFRYAGGASKTFGKLFRNEFNTIEKVARERVKTLQTQYVKLGRDANGALKAISVRPLALDMENLATKTAMAAQKQQLMNQLLRQGSTNLLNFGKNTQWAGRQLMVGFSIPLAYLGTAAAKTFMKMEEQAIRFKRVYGDAFTATSETDKMISQVKSLANEFTKYGVAVEKTMQMSADAAAMGKQGADLLAQVSEATRLAVLGGVEQEQALQTTISLTNAFGVSAEKLSGKINFLNAVENQTVTSIEDLTIAIPKAGPVVQQLGGDVEDLAFFLTAMKEGGINASEGANALKSGLASLINPTSKASEMLAGFGINIKSIVEGNKGDVKGVVVDFAKALDTLDPLNRARAIEQLFGKFQFSRLSTLFQNVIKDGSQASKVLQLTRNTTEELAILSERELKRIEESPMYKFKKSVEDLKVSLAPLGEAFLKAVTPIVEFVKGFLDKFNSMGEGAKQFAVIATTVIAGIGPILLMTFGLIANGAANLIKLFLGVSKIFQRTGQGSQTLGSQTEYMTQQQLEAAAVAASLDQNHSKLIQTFTSETNAVNRLASAYARAVVAQSKLSGIGIGTVAAKTKAPKKLASGIVSVPGPKGAGDVVPAMLSPGEAVIPAKMANKYSGLIGGMIDDTIPGFFDGKKSRYDTSTPGGLVQNLSRKLRESPESFKKAAAELGYGSFIKEDQVVRSVLKSQFPDLRQSQIDNYIGKYDLSHINKTETKQNVGGKDISVKTWQATNIQKEHRLVNQAMENMANKKGFLSSFSPKDIASLTGLSQTISAKELKKLQAGGHPNNRHGYEVLKAISSQAMSHPAYKGGTKPYFAVALESLLDYRLKDKSSGSYLKALTDGKLSIDPKLAAKLDASAAQTQKSKIENARKKLAALGTALPTSTKTAKPKTNAKKAGPQVIDISKVLSNGSISSTVAMRGGKAGMLARIFGRKYADGIVSVPGPKGSGDVVPAMLSPGESVIPAGMSKKYSPLINAMIDGKVPGYKSGLDAPQFNPDPDPFGPGATQSYDNKKAGKFGNAVGDAIRNKIVPAGAQFGKQAINKIADGTGKVGKKIWQSTKDAAVNAGSRQASRLTGGANVVVGANGKEYSNGVRVSTDSAGRSLHYIADPNSKNGERKVSADAAKAYSAQQAKQGKSGRIGGAAAGIGGVASTAGMMMMMGGDQSGMGQGIMTAGMVLSMLPMLANPIALVAASVVGLSVAGFALKGAFDKAQDSAMTLAETMGPGEKAMRSLAEASGNVSAGEIMDKRRQNQLGMFQVKPGKTTFGESFVQQEYGKSMVAGIRQTMSKDTVAAQSSLVNQMGSAVTSGSLSFAEAKSVVANIATELNNTAFGINVIAKLEEIIGPNGENLAKDPLEVRVKLIKETQKSAAAQSANLSKVEDPFAVLGKAALATGASAAIGAGIASAIPIPVISTAVGAVAGTIVGISANAKSVADSFSKMGAASGATVATGLIAMQQQQEMLDSLELEYEKRIGIATAAGDTAKADQLQLDLIAARQKLIDQNKATTGIVLDTYKNAGFAGQGAMGQAADKAIENKYKDDPLMQQVAIGARDQIVAASGLDQTQEYQMKLMLASGDLDPLTVTNLLNTFGTDSKQMTSVLNVMTNLGTAQGGQALQVMNMFQNPDGTPIVDQQTTFMANLEKKDPEDAGKYIEMFLNAKNIGKVVPLGVVMSFYNKNPKAAKEYQDFMDKVNAVDGKMSVDFVQNLLGEEDFNAFKKNQEYFDSLSPEQQKDYLSTYKNLLQLEGDPDMQAAYKLWLKEDGNAGKMFEDFSASKAVKLTEGKKDDTKGDGDPDPAAPTGGTKTEVLDDLLKKLQNVRKAAVNATGGMKELMKWMKSGNDFTGFNGIEQQLSTKGYNEEFIRFMADADKATQDRFMTNKKGIVTLKSEGKALQNLFNAITLGNYQRSIESSVNASYRELSARKELLASSLSYDEAIEASRDSSVSEAIAAIKASTAIKDKAKEIQKVIDLYIKQKKAAESTKTIEEKIDESYQKAMDYFSPRTQEIEINFSIATKQYQDTIDAAQADIDKKINQAGGLDDLQAGLTEIGWQEDKINEKYDLRIAALDKVAEANDKIAQSQKAQLGLADALSRGDISAAAKAAQDMQATDTKNAIDLQRSLIEDSKQSELNGLTTSVNGQKLTRKQIEEKILSVEKEIFAIEESRLEPARESIRLKEVEKAIALGSLESQKLEWEKVLNNVKLTATAAWDYVAALKAAQGLEKQNSTNALPGPVSTWIAAGIDPAKASQDYANSQKAFTSSGLSVSAYMRAVDSGQNFGFKSAFSSGGMVKYFANGGTPLGTDIIPAMLTPGEFVMSKYSVDNFGVDRLKAINNGTYSGESVYNYELNVNVRSDANADEIARSVMTQIKQIDSQRLRGNRL